MLYRPEPSEREPMRVAYFGHDIADAAIRRRVQALQDDGCAVTGYMMRRRAPLAQEWPNIDLGETRDAAFAQRLKQIFLGAEIAARQENNLASADVIIARNLDMLACAFLAKRRAKLKVPVIYECLDIHRLLCRKDVVGKALRFLEGWLLKKTSGLIVSSPAFLTEHFERFYSGMFQAHIVENRLAARGNYGGRCPAGKGEVQGRLRIGWVGNLRCQRSLDLLCTVAERFPDNVEIHLHGIPAYTEVSRFDQQVAAHSNIIFHGRYRAPEDLASIYSGLDCIWAGDFMEAGQNSVWLLPNRIYEGGYFCTPPIAPTGTETAHWIERHECGFVLDDPLEQSLPGLAAQLLADASPLQVRARKLAELPDHIFVQPPGFLGKIIRNSVAQQAI
ncbi:MAG: hypothetical protein B7X55_09095 [Rhodobacterales bacterium 34-62-10]|nr:MAG: hypothetical protein B7X55_09095 [Rhodobacterales bacterium 34-62-10]